MKPRDFNKAPRSAFPINGGVGVLIALSALLLCALAGPIGGTCDTLAASEQDAHEASLTEINKKLTNPVSSLWSLSFQQTTIIWTCRGVGSRTFNSSLSCRSL